MLSLSHCQADESTGHIVATYLIKGAVASAPPSPSRSRFIRKARRRELKWRPSHRTPKRARSTNSPRCSSKPLPESGRAARPSSACLSTADIVLDVNFSDFFAFAVPAAVVVGGILGVASYLADRAGVAPWLVWLTAAPPPERDGRASYAPMVRLSVDGAERFCGTGAQLKRGLLSAGLDPCLATDVGLYRPAASLRLSEFPPEVIDLVQSCYDCGTCRGADFSRLLEDGAPMPAGMCLWFFLEIDDSEPVVTSFVAFDPDCRSRAI